MARRRRAFEAFNLAFLDVVSCGFGAIILLLVVSKWAEPAAIIQVQADLSSVVEALERERVKIRGEAAAHRKTLAEGRSALAAERQAMAKINQGLAHLAGREAAAKSDIDVARVIEGQLSSAQQTLTEEMKRLAAERPKRKRPTAPVGGIPVDSEYIIFIVDTSGSMKEYAWPAVLRKVSEVLDVYPKVKGMQVMNDMGEYMFSRYAGQWIPDTPGRRRAILKRLRSWAPFSNSSPVEGITAAIRTYYAPDKKISLYVFGDEFARGSLEPVVQEVDRINKRSRSGRRLVRIHGIGFPTQFIRSGRGEQTGIRFAALMRILAHRNGGTFVGLNSLSGK